MCIRDRRNLSFTASLLASSPPSVPPRTRRASAAVFTVALARTSLIFQSPSWFLRSSSVA
eukprot:9943877-Lingulodinium_polyedra.AAC.1